MKHTVYIVCLAAALTVGVAAVAQEVTSSVSSGIGVVMPPKASPLDTPVQSNTASPPAVTGGPDPYLPNAGTSDYAGTGEPGYVPGSEPFPGVDSEAPVVPPCGHQDLIGKHIKDVNVEALGTVRVLYPDSMVTEDYSPSRLNIMLEKGTDIIAQVTCG